MAPDYTHLCLKLPTLVTVVNDHKLGPLLAKH